MPAYAYTGLDSLGKTVKGIETADSVPALKVALKRKGVYLTAVSEAASGSAASSKATGGGGGGAIEIDLARDRLRGPRDGREVERDGGRPADVGDGGDQFDDGEEAREHDR